MKPFYISIGLLLTLFAALSLNAQKLYTWTDETGVVHLADQPPPETDRVEDVEVFRYKEKTPQEIEAIQHKKENLRRKFDREEQIEKRAGLKYRPEKPKNGLKKPCNRHKKNTNTARNIFADSPPPKTKERSSENGLTVSKLKSKLPRPRRKQPLSKLKRPP